MATDFTDRGAFNVNGQWATSVRYQVEFDNGAATGVALRFANGRTELASTRVTLTQAHELLGERNHAAIRSRIDKALAARHSADAGSPTAPVSGELRGQDLEFRQVSLADHRAESSENTIAFDSRSRAHDETANNRPAARHHNTHDTHDKLSARDVVAGTAHAAQIIGGAHPVVHAVAQGIGIADAAKVAIDAANGKDVRATDAAAAAASLTLSAGLGGPGVQAAAKVVAAAGAADTLRRAVNTADPSDQRPGDGTEHAIDEARQKKLKLARMTAVPDSVSERFLKVDDKYYFPDKTLAFTDKGTKLKAETHNLEVIRSLVAIAETRDWQAVTVKGNADFRREIWREASLRGIDVRGYEPTDLERAELARTMSRRAPNGESARSESIAQASLTDGTQHLRPSNANTSTNTRPTTATAAPTRPELVTGRLVDFGAAPYKFNPKEGLSYYIKLDTERGERVLWGVDLERALVESRTKVKLGEIVSAENRSSTPTTVKVPQRDEAGELVGFKEIMTRRNAWVIESTAYFEERALKAAAFRQSATATDAKAELVREHPDLTNAVVGLWLGEQFAQRIMDRPQDRDRLVAMVKERLAQALERGEAISAPKLKRDIARELNEHTDAADARTHSPRSKTPPMRTPPEHEQEIPPHVRA